MNYNPARCPACHNLIESPTERPDLPWYRCHKHDCPDATLEVITRHII